jgi:outer membrane scaffolding protein for murein synthesis (MipA/OmpV family)
MKLQSTSVLICAMACAMLAHDSYAGDIANAVRQGGGIPDASDGGYVEVGGGALYLESPIYGVPEDGQEETVPILTVNARYQFKGLFVEAFSESENSLNLGYNAWNSDHWLFDIIMSNQHYELSEEVSDKLAGLRRRKADMMSGVRFTGYYGSYITQLLLLHDISDTHHGHVGNFNIGRGWQARNWNLHALVGARYRSKKVNDYYFGVRDYEASEQFPAYEAGDGTYYMAELGITYPVNENWVFRSFVRHTQLPDDLMGSPLIVDDKLLFFATSLNFVF